MSALWAITCFFNPAGYGRWLRNYRWFRERLSVPLVTVELSFTGEFSLRGADADVLVQLDQGDIMFQKERLLNVALAHLPPSCRAVAWLDCDVVFGSADWPGRTLDALGHAPLIQPFEYRHDFLEDSVPDDLKRWSRPPDRMSIIAKIHKDKVTAECFENGRPPIGKPAWGLAWAARKELLDRHGLYDGCVIPFSDVAIACAGLGYTDSVYLRTGMNGPLYRHFTAWARPFYNDVRGNVGYIEGALFHLWHGNIELRRYRALRDEMTHFDFDPAADVAINEQGAYRWNSGKAAMHEHVREYFISRHEDGVAGVVGGTRA